MVMVWSALLEFVRVRAFVLWRRGEDGGPVVNAAPAYG